MAKKKPIKKVTKVATKPVQETVTTHKLSNVIALSRKSLLIIGQHKLLFAGIIGVYTLLMIVFVTGLGVAVDLASIKGQFGNQVVGNLAAYTQLLGSSAGAPSEAAGVYQLFITLFVILALIWTLRQLYANQTVRVRDAYYQGLSPLVPFMLVLLVLGLQLLPMVIGSGLYQVVVSNGIASSGLEIVLWLTLTLALTLLSAYFIAATLFALIIATLPDMQPVQALKLARKLVRSRRWTVLRKLLFLPVVLLLIASVIILPLVVLVPPVAQITLVLLNPLLLLVAVSYCYTLYRELMGD